MALSKASPMLPIEATTPEVRRVRPKSMEVYWDAVVAVVDQPVAGFAAATPSRRRREPARGAGDLPSPSPRPGAQASITTAR
jgi:hypothetical protein